MPFDGITLFGVIHELSQKLIGANINKIYQPSNLEIILFMRSGYEDYKLVISADSLNCRMHLTDSPIDNPTTPPMFCMLLRKHLLGGKIEAINQKGLERIVEITIKNQDEYMQPVKYKLIAEIMGKHSNIILIDSKDNTIIDSIKRITLQNNRYREILPGKTYSDPPLQKKIDLTAVDNNDIMSIIEDQLLSEDKPVSLWIVNNFTGFSGASAQEIALRAGINHKTLVCQLSRNDIKEISTALKQLHSELTQFRFDPHVYLDKDKKPVDFWIFPMLSCKKEISASRSTISEVIDLFFSQKKEAMTFDQKKKYLISLVSKQIRKLNQNLDHLKIKIDTTSEMDKYKLWGDILSANLYRVKPYQRSVKLPNYFNNNEDILIPLNEKLSPAQNAQNYYKRYKKLQSTKKIVEERLNSLTMEIEYLKSTLVNLEQSTNLDDLLEIQHELKTQNYIKTTNDVSKTDKPKNSVKSKPLTFMSSEGIIIRVGKNNRQNDQLTFKKAKSDDIWLHAKNIPGSHVIIESGGSKVSDKTIREAAMLAAYFSKARTGSNVPVDYTNVRYVKKPAGAKPGFVVYFHQKTIYVTPDENLMTKLSL